MIYIIKKTKKTDPTSDLPCQLFYGMVWEEERKRRKRKKRCGGENEEELGGIGLFGPFTRISNSEEKSQPARQKNRIESSKISRQ